MFFSAAEYIPYHRRVYGRTLSLEAARLFMREIKERVIQREIDPNYGSNTRLTHGHYLAKWHRPWTVVPALANFTPPENDFGIGVEVEMGFRTRALAGNIIQKIANWKHIAIDAEGGEHGVETTFPPILYSKLNKRSQVVRYLDLLEENRSTVADHGGYQVGTHVNVSWGSRRVPSGRLDLLNSYLRGLPSDQKHRYFNRIPYGYGYNRQSGKFIEWKLFNSVPHSRLIFRYVDIAVELTKLVHGPYEDINERSVLAALERGYNKRTSA